MAVLTRNGKSSRHELRGVLSKMSVVVNTLLGVLLLPCVWLAAGLVTILNTLLFCASALARRYVDRLEADARQAHSYGEWRNCQAQLDERRQTPTWADHDEDHSYDWRGLRTFKDELELCRRRDDYAALRGSLRAQATRNSCSMLSPRLYLKSKIQTKKLIHEYVHEVRRCVEQLTRRESSTRQDPAHIDEERRRFFSEVRQILGRTTLVLQGGAMISLCHLGVVKALHRRRLLPKIITATGTGALVAAIVGTTPDHELISALEGSSINIDAFIQAREQRNHADTSRGSFPLISWARAIIRRISRFLYTGHFFDIDVLTRCVRDNIGDVTFEEAFVKSGRILNITIARPEVEGTPQLLNYITAPHVVVWSAVAASVSTSKSMFAAAPLKSKDEVGIIGRYHAVDSPSAFNTRRPVPHLRIPMERIGELFDVNHYIVSQTRPYIIPFIRLRDFAFQDPILGAITRVVYCEAIHRLGTLNRLGLVPTVIKRIYIDELTPSTSSWSKFVIAPDLSVFDYFKAVNFPSPKVIDEWAMKGEKSVWPKVCELKVRCCVEFDIDAASRRGSVKPGSARGQPQPETVNGHSG